MNCNPNPVPRPALRLSVVLLLTVLAACSARHKLKKVKPDKPLPLAEIATTLKVERVWHAGLNVAPKLRLGLDAAAFGNMVYIAGHKGEVEALDAATGRVKWRREVKAPLSAGPGVGEDLVVVASSEGDVIALNPADGAERWRTRVLSEVLAAPAVGGDTVIVRTVDGKLRALEAKDGSQRWIADQQLPKLTLRGNAPPSISGDMVLAGFDNGRLLAVTLAGGTTLWDTAVGQAHGSSELQRLVDIDSGVAIDGDDLFVVSFQGRVVRIARDTGQTIWTRDMSSYRGLAIDATAVYVSTAAGEVVRLNRSSGAEEWKQAALLRRQLSAPLVLGTHIVVADLEGIVHWLDAADGHFVARIKVGARVSMPPIAAGAMVLVTNDKGEVTALRVHGTVPPAKSKGAADAKPSG